MVMGTLICIGGALLLTMYKGVPLTKLHNLETHSSINNKSAMKPENWIIGCVLLFAGSSCFGSWMLIQSKVNDKYPCQYSSTVLLSFFGTIQCALLSLIKSRDIAAWILTDKLDIMTVVYAVSFFLPFSYLAKHRFSICFAVKKLFYLHPRQGGD